jgi:Arc/MetJ family transcription regulator
MAAMKNPHRVDLDDELLAKAKGLTGESDPSALIHLALITLVEREVAKCLVRAGASEPWLEPTPRRQGKA